VQHLHEDDLELYLLGRVPEDKAAAIESHVRACQACESQLNEAVEFIRQVAASSRGHSSAEGGEKRREPRSPKDDPAAIRALSPLRSDELDVRVLNASNGGLMLRTTKFFEAGTLVQLRLNKAIVLGEVRYCYRSEHGFHAGIRIHEQLHGTVEQAR
jgi:anti-sigma factor RsiW